MSKYHVSPETGKPGLCRAKTACPFGGPDSHFPSEEKARQSYEDHMGSGFASPALTRGERLASEALAHGDEITFKDHYGAVRKLSQMGEQDSASENCGYASWATVDFLVARGEAKASDIGVTSYEGAHMNHDIICMGETIIDLTCRQFEPEGPLYRVQDKIAYEAWLGQSHIIGRIHAQDHFPADYED